MKNEARFQFGQVVIVETNLVGVIVKTWQTLLSGSSGNKVGSFHYDVYVRSYNGVGQYDEEEIRQMIYDKELTDDQLEFYK